jgi:hypothetical protein
MNALIAQLSISKLVFLLVAITVCWLVIEWRMTVDQFMNIVMMVFGSYYVQKANDKTVATASDNTSDNVK